VQDFFNPPALVSQAEETDEQIVAHCKEAMAVSDRSSWDVAGDYEKLSRRGCVDRGQELSRFRGQD
jgi:hypothetical protein